MSDIAVYCSSLTFSWNLLTNHTASDCRNVSYSPP